MGFLSLPLLFQPLAYVEVIQDVNADWMRKHKVDYIVADHGWPDSSLATSDAKSTNIIKSAIFREDINFRSFDWAVQWFVHGRVLDVGDNR